MDKLGLWFAVIVIAACVGALVNVDLRERQYTDDDIARLHLEHSQAMLNKTVENAEQGRPLTEGETEFVAPTQAWPIEHPGLSGLIVAVALLVVIRIGVFMVRVESRSPLHAPVPNR